MANEERLELEPIEAQALAPDDPQYEDSDDDMILSPDGWEPRNAQQYYFDLDEVLAELNVSSEEFPYPTATYAQGRRHDGSSPLRY
jgi:hypothetical protein